jgi:hypothetical protein
VMSQPDEEGRQAEIPDDLVEKGRVEGREGRISGRTVRG